MGTPGKDGRHSSGIRLARRINIEASPAPGRSTMQEEPEALNVLKSSNPAFRASGDANGIRRPGRNVVRAFALFLAVALPGASLRAQDPSPDTGPSPAAETENPSAANPLDVDLLLADPVRDLPPFQALRDRLHELAAGDRSPEAFAAAAEDLAADGVYATAIQILWFASKLVADEAKADDYAKQMNVWSRAALPAAKLIEQGEQLQVAGRDREAIETYILAVEAHPFNERAHFRLADAWRDVYEKEYGDELSLAPLAIRVRLFRDAYVHYHLALEIDPLFYDARYGLSELRGLFPENQDVLLKTQYLTQQALDFRGEILPVLQVIEQGEADAGTFSKLGGAFEALEEPEYAVFAWQCALTLGASPEELTPRIGEALSASPSGGRPGSEGSR